MPKASQLWFHQGRWTDFPRKEAQGDGGEFFRLKTRRDRQGIPAWSGPWGVSTCPYLMATSLCNMDFKRPTIKGYFS